MHIMSPYNNPLWSM